MARSSDFIDGWSKGWTAATQALLQSLQHLTERGAAALETVRPEMAANKPTPRRRGRPPKSSLLPAQHTPRKRGRPRKTA
jgi:hypothetical protein